MRKNFGAKPSTYPQPVLMIAAYGEDGTPNVMNAAWGGISDDTQISICVSARTQNHKKYSVQKGLYGQHGRGFLCKGM